MVEMPKFKNSNETFLVIFILCVVASIHQSTLETHMITQSCSSIFLCELQQRSIFGPKTQSIVVIICRELKIWLLLILSWKMYANTAVSSQSGYFFLLFGSFFVIASFWHETNLFDVTHSKVQHTDQFAFREQ